MANVEWLSPHEISAYTGCPNNNFLVTSPSCVAASVCARKFVERMSDGRDGFVGWAGTPPTVRVHADCKEVILC